MTPKFFLDTLLIYTITLKNFHTLARTLARCIKNKNFPDQKFLAQNSKKMTLISDVMRPPFSYEAPDVCNMPPNITKTLEMV